MKTETVSKAESVLFKTETRDELKSVLLREGILVDEECAEAVVPAEATCAQVTFFEDEPLFVVTFFTRGLVLVESITF